MMIDFDNNVNNDDRDYALRILNYAYNADYYDNDDKELPFGYVYRVITSDGNVYIGKRKIYPHTEWMHYKGSGVRLNQNRVIRKEFICFGYTMNKLHAIECEYIQKEIDYYQSIGKRDKVLNVKAKVVDGAKYKGNEAYNAFTDRYGLIPIYLYLEFGNAHEVADYLNCSYGMVAKTLNENGIERFSKANHEYNMNEYVNPALNGVIYENGNKRYEFICEQCGKHFTYNHYDAKYCSFECSQKSKMIINDNDKQKITDMLNDGMSLNQIGKKYNTTHNVVLAFIKRNNIDYNENTNKKNNGKWTSHIQWHVRKNKRNSECKYCIDNIGFDDYNKTNQDERARPCMNPYCDKLAVGKDNRTCCSECRQAYACITNNYTSHVSAHVSRNIRSNYCWFCKHDVGKDYDFSILNKNQLKTLADGILELDDCLMNDIRMLSDNTSNRDISKKLGVNRPKINDYLNGIRAFGALREYIAKLQKRADCHD